MTEETQGTQAEPRRQYSPGSSLLGHASQRRREILGATQEDVAERFGGPSVASLRTIENSQADNYRAKTLFSLDAALAWPRGSSMALLTGDFERLDPEHKAYMSDKFGVNLYEPFGPTNSDFDFFVTILITAVSDSDVEAYDIPVRAARTPGSTAKENQKSEAPIADQQPEQQAAIPTTSPVDLPLDTKRKPNTYEYELPPNDYLDLINRLSLGQLRGLKDIAHGALILRDEPQFDEDVEFLQEAERELAAEKSVSEIEANLREAYTDSASGELIDQLYAQYREALGVLGRNSMMNSLLVNAVVNVRRARKFGITGDTKAGDVDG